MDLFKNIRAIADFFGWSYRQWLNDRRRMVKMVQDGVVNNSQSTLTSGGMGLGMNPDSINLPAIVQGAPVSLTMASVGVTSQDISPPRYEGNSESCHTCHN